MNDGTAVKSQPGGQGKAWALGLAGLVIVLLPWFHNRAYVRSFFDYGVVIGGVGRIESGQKPYVDFNTPIQTGWYVMNRLGEQIGGGTFQAMTLSGAASSVLALAALYWILSRRWPRLLAAALATALVAATTAQHTIYWYNPWGVVLLAIVAWSCAVAPVLRRGDWTWHALTAAAIFLGGINKINMQLMALAFAIAWSLRAGVTGRAGWVRVLGTLIFLGACAVLPVLAEMAWTGATWHQWFHNVIALPAANRSGTMMLVFTRDFLFRVIHDYYGYLPVKQVGLIGLIATGLVTAAILRRKWRETGPLDSLLAVAAGLAAAAGGAVLLITNMDIVYIAWAGWFALLAALWLGYDLPARGGWFHASLVVPTLAVGALAWQSAWVGQRSQFGHSTLDRTQYVDGGKIDPAYAYFRGTNLPPDIAVSMREIAGWQRTLSPARRQHWFFGPGSEWLAHIWPAMHTPGLPIYITPGDSAGDAELRRLLRSVNNGVFEDITVSNVLDLWQQDVKLTLDTRFDRGELGAMFGVYTRANVAGLSVSPIWFCHTFGGNVDSRFLTSSGSFQPMGDWHKFIGVDEGHGVMNLTVPCNRLQGSVVIRRLDLKDRQPARAKFGIYAQMNPNALLPRWEQEIVLPSDQDEIVVPYSIDPSHQQTKFTVDILTGEKGKVAAGWTGPSIQHTGADGPEDPQWFVRSDASVFTLTAPVQDKLIPGSWRAVKGFMRRGELTPAGDAAVLAPGGEIWLRVHGNVSDLSIKATANWAFGPTAEPVVRCFWYSSGRMEVYSEGPVHPDSLTKDIRAWSAEPGGWIVVVFDPTPVTAPKVTIRITHAAGNE